MTLKLESLEDLGVYLDIVTEQDVENRLTALCCQCFAQTEKGSYLVIDKEEGHPWPRRGRGWKDKRASLYRPICSAPCLLAWMKVRKEELRAEYWTRMQYTDTSYSYPYMSQTGTIHV